MEVGIKEHVFGPTNVKKHFPEAELKNRLLEMDSLVQWER